MELFELVALSQRAWQVDEVVLAKHEDLQIRQVGDVLGETLKVVVAQVESSQRWNEEEVA